MEKTYFVQRQTMSGIADEVRTLSGDGVMMKPETMREELVEANDAVVEQDGIMNEIRDILSSKRIPDETLEGLDEYVDFYDYDGTLLHRYTVLEVMGMDELPPLPQHEGLICQGWNWTLEQLKEEHGGVDVAPFYRTDTGDTRIYVEIPYDGYTFGARGPSYSVDINWGDSEEFTRYNLTYYSHKYETKGKYVITIRSSSTYYLNTSGYAIMSGFSGSGQIDSAAYITNIESGDNLNFNNSAFTGMAGLKTLTQTKSMDPITSAFHNCGLKLVILGTRLGKSMLHNAVCRCIFSYKTYQMDESFGYNFYGEGRVPRTFRAIYRYGFSQSSASFKLFRPYDTYGSQLPDRMFQTSNFDKIIIPETITSMSVAVFYGCSAREIILPDTIKTLGHYTFEECANLEKIKLPVNLQRINNRCFVGCKRLKNLKLPNSVTYVGEYGLQAVDIRELPESLASTGAQAFASTPLNGDLDLLNMVSVGSRTFSNCHYINSVHFGDMLTTLSDYCFLGCSSLKYVYIGKNIANIGTNTFDGCRSLMEIHFIDCENVPTLANSVMPENARIYVPSALYNDWIKATNWSAIASRIVPV